MKKINVDICCGTSCYIMGASELINHPILEDNRIEVRGVTCLDMCKEGKDRPPYVIINTKKYSQITKNTFERIIKEELNAL